jgi:hypothetical protein
MGKSMTEGNPMGSAGCSNRKKAFTKANSKTAKGPATGEPFTTMAPFSKEYSSTALSSKKLITNQCKRV